MTEPPTADPYYDGATDALRELIGEIKAAWIVSPVKYQDYGSDHDYYQAVAIEAITALYESYVRDAKFNQNYYAKQIARVKEG